MALNITSKYIKDEYEYTPESQRGEDKPFSVTFKRLSLEKVAKLSDAAITIEATGGYNLNANQQSVSVLQASLIGWENISDGKKPLKFSIERGVPSESTLLAIPEEIRTEISLMIMAVSRDPQNAESILTGGDTSEENNA